MKKTFKFFAAALAIVAAASCAKEISNDNIQNENPAEETVHMTFSASFDSEGETKTVLAKKNFVHWTDEDAIGVYAYNEYETRLYAPFVIDATSNDQDPTFAVFEGDIPYNSSNSYYGVFPASGWAPTLIQFNDGLASQKAVKDSFDPAKHVVVSEKARGGTYDHFVFHNVCALLKVTLAIDNIYSIKVTGSHTHGSTNYGIGDSFGFYTSDLSAKTYSFGYWSEDGFNDITLANADSTPLENGATYYIVVPHVTVKGFNVSLYNAEGKVIAQKSKASDFKIERNKIYNLGTFDESLVKPEEELSVSASSISIAEIDAAASFTISANRNWKATSNVNWLTLSSTSGTSGSNIMVNVAAENNPNTYSRSATITITGENETRTIQVTQAAGHTYRIVGDKLKYAYDLTDGLYVIASKYDSNKFWSASNGKLATTTKSKDADFYLRQIFEYKSDASKINTSIDTYHSWSAGTWKSMTTGKYLDENLNLTADENSAVYLVFANNWGGHGGEELNGFDVYHSNSTSSDKSTLWLNTDRYELVFGDMKLYYSDTDANSVNKRKYYVYKVVAQ